MRPSPFRPGRAGDPPPPQSFRGAAPHSWAGCPPSCVSRHCPLRKREPVYAAGLLTGGSGEGGRSVLTNGLTGTVTSGKHMLKRVTGRRGHREPSTQSGNLSPTSPRGRPPARRLHEEAARRGAFRSRGDNGARVREGRAPGPGPAFPPSPRSAASAHPRGAVPPGEAQRLRGWDEGDVNTAHEQRGHTETHRQNTRWAAHEFLETSKEKGSGPRLHGGVSRLPPDPTPPGAPAAPSRSGRQGQGQRLRTHGPQGEALRQESPRGTRLLARRPGKRGSPPSETRLASPRHTHQQQRGRREAGRGSDDEVRKEEPTSLGFQNKNSNQGSEKKKRQRNWNQWTEKYGLLTRPLCIQFHMKNTPIHHNTVQMFATKDL